MKERKKGWIVPAREKACYFIGGGSYMAVNAFVTAFLAAYLLMIGIDTTTAALVLLLLKVWDAVNDFLFGFLIDKVRFHPGKNKFLNWLLRGRYLPWFRMGILVLPLSMVIMFSVNPAAKTWVKVLQYAVGYLLFDTGYTLVSTPYNCTLMSLTNNLEERTFLQSFATLISGVGSLPVTIFGTAFVTGSLGYTGSAIIFAVLSILLAIPAMFGVKERNADVVTASEERYTLGQMAKVLFSSKDFLFFELAQLAWGMFYTSGYLLFLAYYIFGNANASLIYLAMGAVPTIALVPFLPLLFKRVSKITALRFASLMYVAATFTIYFLGPDWAKANLPWHYLMYGVGALGYSFNLIAGIMAVPDLAESVRYRAKTDNAGIIFSVHSFVQKLVGSLATSVSLLILGAYGYVSVTANSFEELQALNAQGIGLQTERALEGLWNVTFLFPAIGFAAAAVLFCFCRISNHKVRIMMQANSGQITGDEAKRQLGE